MTRPKTNPTPFEVPGQSGPAKPDRSGIAWSTRCALCNAPMFAERSACALHLRQLKEPAPGAMRLPRVGANPCHYRVEIVR